MKKINLFFLMIAIALTQNVFAQDVIQVKMPAPITEADILSVDISNAEPDETLSQGDPVADEILSSLSESEVFPENEEPDFDAIAQNPDNYDNGTTKTIVQNETITIPGDSKYLHPLLSLDFSDSVFTKLSELENKKFILDLETKKNQMELELSKIKRDQLKLDNEIKKLEGAESTEIESTQNQNGTAVIQQVQNEDSSKTFEITSTYEIKNISGIGGNLVATINNIQQNKKLKVRAGTTIGDGLIVRSISATDGIIFQKGKKFYPLKIKQN